MIYFKWVGGLYAYFFIEMGLISFLSAGRSSDSLLDLVINGFPFLSEQLCV